MAASDRLEGFMVKIMWNDTTLVGYCADTYLDAQGDYRYLVKPTHQEFVNKGCRINHTVSAEEIVAILGRAS